MSRPTWRHNSILRVLKAELSQILSPEHDIILDTAEERAHYSSTQKLYFPDSKQRPDVSIINESTKTIFLLELTSPSSRYINTWHENKTNRYVQLCNDIASKHEVTVHCYAFEVDQLGFVASSTLEMLKGLGLSKKEVKHVGTLLSKKALECSYHIFCHRDTDHWPFPLG